MRRAYLLAVLTVSLALSFAAPSTAAAVRISLEPAQQTSATTALLTGSVTSRTAVSTVTVEVQEGYRWRPVQTVPVDGTGAFQATVPATSAAVWYRARASRYTSQKVVVQAVAVVPDPEPDPVPVPEPEPDPEPEAPAPTPGDPCGPQLTKADGTPWVCTMVDDFAGTSLDRSVWMPQTIFQSGTTSAWACYLDDPSVVSVHDGALHLTVRKLPQAIACPGNNNASTPYVAGSVATYRLFSQQFGRFEARIKTSATTAPGLQEAFWLWPDDRYSTGYWPAAGEIDIAETYSQYPSLAIPFLHYTWYDNWGPVPGLNTAWHCAANRGEYNTYALEWTDTRLEVFINGQSCLVNTSGDPAFKQRYIVALTQMLGTGANALTSSTPLPASMAVDYVRVWK